MSDQKGIMYHVERPRLPWRNDALTECGLPTAGHPVITRDALYCPRCDEWRERGCSDPACDYCADRPERPSLAGDPGRERGPIRRRRKAGKP